MSTVFKYCDQYGLNILDQLELKVTPPNQFNDPFEFTPHVVCSSPNRYFKVWLEDRDNLERVFLQQTVSGNFKGTFKEFKKHLKNNKSTYISNLIPKMPELNARIQATNLDYISKQSGVLCMSTRSDSILMWGHYCAKHSGIVIGFNSSWFVSHSDGGLLPVRYVRKRVNWDSSWLPGGKAWLQFNNEVICSKNDEWSYECEVRKYFNLDSLKKRTLKTGLGFFLPIQPHIVTSVYLGFRCSAKLEEEVRSVLSRPQFSNVKLYRARLHDTEFSLTFE